MAKIIVSSLSCQIWLESFWLQQDEYEIEIKKSALWLGQDYLVGETQGEGSAILTKERIMDFIAILKHLQDQPILLIIDSEHLWLWQAML